MWKVVVTRKMVTTGWRGGGDSGGDGRAAAGAYTQTRGKARALDMTNVNPNIVKLQYAVRGPLVIRSMAIKKELAEGAKKPFDKVISANVGDAHAMGQKPITWIRQVLACVSCPYIMDQIDFPSDVKQRAKKILAACSGGSVGSYSQSYGIECIRHSVAKFIEKRDGGIPSNQADILLSAGASSSIKSVLQLLVNKVDGKNTGVMIPIPQYPLYSATLAEFDLTPVSYYLNEDKNWALDVEELERAISEARNKCAVRALVIINPGNPTGQVLSRENIEGIIKFADKYGLLVFADEVYQVNVYVGEFHSFKKVMTEMGVKLELASFNSVSKGYSGECGLRGGWVELVNFDAEVQANLYKAVSANLCSTTLGQTAVECIARPPNQGDESYDLWKKEKDGIIQALNERSKIVVETFNSMKGFKCNVVQGAMYAFPKIDLPPKAIEVAKGKNQPADVFYAFKLLEETGICIIPGSGFGQKPGTYHFRTTLLPQTPLLKEMCNVFQKFHEKFADEFK